MSGTTWTDHDWRLVHAEPQPPGRHLVQHHVIQGHVQRHGIEVVRRISGGGAMFIEPGNTIT